MIKVGFLLNFTVEYKGGINYLKNLLYAVNQYHSNDLDLVLFVPKNLDAAYEELFSPNAKIIRTKILQPYTLSWIISRVADKYFGFDPMVFYLLKKNKINCITHSNYVYPFSDIKCINWVPDFQYLHYPNLWKPKQLSEVKNAHKNWIHKSDLIIVSSYAAKNDLETLFPDFSEKVEVLHFVSQPEIDINNKIDFETERSFEGEYFYLPNQFWLHKNHLVVFKAIKVLKDRGVEVKLITTGSQNDYRDGGQHFNNLLQYVRDNNLDKNISFLGLVPYNLVFSLMQKSLAIINPSKFEGWSSTVEESKSIEKIIVLSDIPVHREQCPSKGIYFDPNDENKLADILELLWNNEYFINSDLPEQKSLSLRTKEFSDKFFEIIMRLYK